MAVELLLLSRVAHRGREVTAPRLRALLALLAEDPPAGRSTRSLAAGLWPEEPPERPAKAVQVLVSRLRSALGAEVVANTPQGYRLTLPPEAVDSAALPRLAGEAGRLAAAGDAAGALARAEEGLALWDGALDEDGDPYDPLTALRRACAGAHRELRRHRALALVALGRAPEAAPALEALAAELPRDEEVLAALLRCDEATMGPAAALARYESYRRALREELGADPGAELVALHRELLRSQAPAARHGVRFEPNALLGRDEERAAVLRLTRASRVVSVVGPGGLGKTRLAHAVCRESEHRVVHFVPLAGVTSDGDVAAEVASALGAAETRLAGLGGGPGDPVSAIVAALGRGPSLLALDNCEHVVEGAARLVREVVAGAREVTVLVTSRTPLGLSSESVYALPPLAPAACAALFEQRARAARPGVELPPETVAELCAQLDGLPLAVELAAARVRALSVAEIAARLGDRFALLRGGARDVPERHRTLAAVVGWSWNLLDEEARAALRALSVFPGGFTEGAAGRLLTGAPGAGPGGQADADVLPVLERLVDHSLLGVEDDAGGGVRFRMLESVREFGAARRAEAGEEAAVTDRFLAWARDFGRTDHRALLGPSPRSAWERIRVEQDNLLLALRQAVAREDGSTLAATGALLAALWSTDGHFSGMAQLCSEIGPALSRVRPGEADVEAVRTAAALCAASLVMANGPRASRHLAVLRRLPRPAPDDPVGAVALVLTAITEAHPPDYAPLRALCAAPEPMLAGIAECAASYVWEFEHDVDEALASARRASAALEPTGIPTLLVMTGGRIGELCLQTARGEEAYRRLRSVFATQQEMGGWADVDGIRWGLVLACLQRGALDEAEHWLAQAAAEQDARQDAVFSPELGARAEIALSRGRIDEGLRLWRLAVARLEALPVPAGGAAYLEPWGLLVRSVALVAHARHGRLAEVAELPAALWRGLRGQFGGAGCVPEEDAATPARPTTAGLPVAGTALLALGLAGVAGGDRAAVRLLALAERLRVVRDFQPTMAPEEPRRTAEETDPAGFAEAAAGYAALSPGELAGALRAVLVDRPEPSRPAQRAGSRR
ncbi:AfsR/SARP family transcriptional regulator [Streptomyces sp. 3MP-14]|uniref:AfsR/SARP family transcriptional regulator n=1 Tax=Streptomyces mimosae TaxID=2586635 RepID=A0A5N6A3K3_9ACTN|nr:MULTISPECIES: BTAD domain-containing putative transcriptional regulator [Streptomyces]KAB8163367.1 AfsR/SARP family transcriptional regulator [Streptomyces mimosae]KAB8174644.1 AfsR/SARP family transcriptional regulator [Streptomyces sp. 3MP-14]